MRKHSNTKLIELVRAQKSEEGRTMMNELEATNLLELVHEASTHATRRFCRAERDGSGQRGCCEPPPHGC